MSFAKLLNVRAFPAKRNYLDEQLASAKLRIWQEFEGDSLATIVPDIAWAHNKATTCVGQYRKFISDEALVLLRDEITLMLLRVRLTKGPI